MDVKPRRFRSCGLCRCCCVGLRIEDPEFSTQKPPGEPCPHLAPFPRGCGRYETRPAVCRDYQCLWSIMGLRIFDCVGDRPDSLGVLFTPKMASDCALPLRNGADWLLVVALPVQGHTTIADHPKAMEAVRRIRVAGLGVLLDERTATGCPPIFELPLRRPSDEFVATLSTALLPQDPTDGIPQEM